LVCQKGEQNIPDRSPQFFVETSRILSFHFEREINLINPFDHMTKVQMVRWYLDQELSVTNLLNTVSCYSKDDGQCGQCGSCFRRYVALEINGIKDQFKGNILQWGIDHYGDRLDEYQDCRREDLERIFA
jgi:7-cyano-7-deazaguanine synthase in queuosine biosynthesis